MAKTTSYIMKPLNETITSKGTEYHRNKIVKHNDKKFKIIYENRNGRQTIYVEVMTINGDFACVLTHYDIGHTFACSYVGNEDSKNIDSRKAIELAEKLIAKIYEI